MKLTQVTDERSANEGLEGVVVGDTLRITFNQEAGDTIYDKFASLRSKLEFDFEWLVLVNNSFVTTRSWGRHSRAQNFTIKRMSPADREVFAHILADIAESIEVL
jgi:hypothetical protein